MKKILSLIVLITITNISFGQTPTLSCPAPIIVDNDPGLCGAVITYTTPTCATNCTGTSITQIDGTGLTSGDLYAVGTVNMIYQISNGTDSSTCLFKIEVIDVENPVAICPSDFDVYTDSNCEFLIPDFYATGIGSGTDNCGVVNYTQTPAPGTSITTLNSASAISIEVEDDAGNTDQCSFNVTLVDSTAPSITCPGTITEPTTSGCQALLQNYIALAAVSDVCDINPTVTQSPAAGTSFTTSESVTIYAEDASGNIDSCSFNVVAADIVAPSITCPSDMDVYADAACEYLIVDFTSMAVTSDNCDPSISVLQTPTVGTKVTGNGTSQFISFQGMDIAGNSSTCSFEITVTDTLAPTFTLCQDTIIPLDNNCEHIVGSYVPIIGIAENCSSYSTLQIPVAGSVISGEATTQLVISVTDLSNNSATCVMDIITIDTTSPNLGSCPSDITVSTGATDCSYIVPDFSPDVFAVDNCSSVFSVDHSIAIGTSLAAGTHNMILEVSDDAGNVSSCTFDITVEDLVLPDLICPSNPTVAIDNNCQYVIPSYDTVLSITDNCVALANFTQTPAAGIVIAGIGTTQSISLSIEDGSGNINSCSFMITLADTTAPTVTCPTTQDLNIDINCQYQIPDFESFVTVSDFCDPSPLYSQSPAIGTLISGINNVDITVTDISGNVNTCTFEVRPNDQDPPTLTCPSSSSSCDSLFSWISPFGNDNCGIVTVTRTDASTLNSGDYFPVGTTTIEYTAEDEVGNTATCDFSLTVFPTPTIILPNTYTISDDDSVNLDAQVDFYESINWSPAYNLSSDTIANPWALPNAPVTYVIVVVSDSGCTVTDSVDVIVIQDLTLIINNYLSPNADGKNDSWTMSKPSLITGCTVTIYDRWGKEVWMTDAYNNQWEGKNMSDVELPEGTYFYSIVCPGEDDRKGSILLMR